jgi:hypothetical protein
MPFEHHPQLPVPPDDTVLWRYMDFARFVSLLDKSALFFSAATNLGDPFEGSLTKHNLAYWMEAFSGIPSDRAAEERADQARLNREQKRFVFANCWHANPVESAAMWAQYAAMDRGIAIKTRFSRLTTSLHPGLTTSIHPETTRVQPIAMYAALVQYVDYDAARIPESNLFFPYIYKRASFAHEQELRLLFYSWPVVGDAESQHLDHSIQSPAGIYIAVDLQVLVEEVHLAPQTPTWVRDLVDSVVKKYGLDKPVLESSLSATPLY